MTMIAQRRCRRGRVWTMRALGAVSLGTIALALAVVFVPFPRGRLERAAAGTAVYDRDGRLLRTYPRPDGQCVIPIRLKRCHRNILDATVAVEDKRFRHHIGVDPVAVLRAAFWDVIRGRVVSGASTITMQLVRLMEPRPRTFRSKAIEAFRALQLEWRLSKDEILEWYLNLAPYGGNLVGVEAAARKYFGKPALELTLDEAALLAGLPQSPCRFRPDRFPRRARRRRDAVLAAMRRCGYITQTEYRHAREKPARVEVHPLPFEAPHFAQLVRDHVGPRGRLVSTLDQRIQTIAERALARQVDALRPSGVTNGSVVVIENRTGAVRALVGSVDFFCEEDDGQVNGAIARRSPGSTLKPFTYALAFGLGLCTPSTTLADVPTAFDGYMPENYDRQYHGLVSASDALARSLNVPAVWLLDQIGPEALRQLLVTLGIHTVKGSPGLPLTLGACEVALLDLTNAYAALARLGEYRPYALIEGSTARETHALGRAACFLVAKALSSHGAEGATPRIALKTGTSQGHRDAWSIAFNPEYTVGVWIGNFSGQPSPSLVGAKAAAPVARAVFAMLYGARAGPWYAPPNDLARRKVCTRSGMPAGPFCPTTRLAWYIRGVSSTQRCPAHKRIMVDNETGAVLCPRCSAGRHWHFDVEEHWPPRVATWLAVHRGLRRRPHLPGCALAQTGAPPLILSPSDGKTYSEFSPGSVFACALSLRAAASTSFVRWFVNGEFLRRVPASEAVFWNPRAGAHTITCVDDDGRGKSARIVVRKNGG